MLHWDRPRDNGSPITGYILRGQKVGGMFREYYNGMANSFVESSHIEGGSDYLFEVKARLGLDDDRRLKPSFKVVGEG